MIAVVGATGNTGRAVVSELRKLGEDPVCVVRDVDKAHAVLGDTARIKLAEITDRAALESAFEGVKRVFVVTGHNPQMAEQQTNILEAAKAAGAELLVKVSGGQAIVSPDSESVVGRGNYAVEQAMKESGLAWIVLRPGLFMQNTFQQAQLVKEQGKLVLPYAADLPIAFIDVRDTGALGARMLLEPDAHVGKEISFTGARTNFSDFAAVFSEVLGKPVSYVPATFEQAGKALKDRGLPDWLVEHLLTVARLGADGAFSTENTGPILEIVGRAPTTTRQFVEDHKAMFS
jgi:uncharacterized protein YbjT (DUF2867 family)